MPDKLDYPVPFQGAANDWYADPTFKRVFTGASHGMKCLCAMGPADFHRVAFSWTGNPRDKLQRVAKGDTEALVVHEALWFPLMQAKRALSELVILLDRARVVEVDRWRRFPKRFLRPLMLQAAEKAGVSGVWHPDFHADVLATETLKLRARLASAGVEPKVIAAHRMV